MFLQPQGFKVAVAPWLGLLCGLWSNALLISCPAKNRRLS